ncbi:DUF5106 domain-containing protein [Parabacteroides sp. PF5-6]|uniref:DUF5106 domain-containing protein n=1 Tax=Parabacteroides sp. PF5-6 TaxID=1742403 RepID=UPI002405204E|nr:DUF5106 domain-containing protein [Parabacteroides sp. PF5-6]MDF9829739.1 hypothetical protein [Parabacteroides sp. PF5-6]
MKYLPILISLLVCLSCSGQQKKKEEGQEKKIPVFEMVTIPSLVTDPQHRMEYAVEHYWDKFNFTDTAYIHHPEVTEQAFSNYLYMMGEVPLEKAVSSIRNMLKKAEVEKQMYTYFTDLFEKYLYDPNAPLRNEELYIPVLQAMVETPLLDEVNKIRPAHLLEVALRNRLGESATDFVYELPDGKKGRLYQVKSDYLLLYFYNPDCENCREVTQAMKESQLINGLLNAGKLKVLSVYPDEDKEAWVNHIPQMPTVWINGQDREVILKNEEIYDLKAIPCLYLLDKNKTVVLKDAPFEQVEAYLYNHSAI